jgi:hypothetical protein|tara:strand:+ start:53672 stop:54286 length:615 start_codon:yes stop_codon:yes gene_type:complete
MKIDIEDVLFWMDAIRNSDNRYRTLESFWKGQVKSKIWLIEALEKHNRSIMNADVVIHGGWNGVLSSLLFNSNLGIRHITSIDIDRTCENTANTINKRYEIQGKFNSITQDMVTYKYDKPPYLIINTSCEHINQEQYLEWLSNVPKSSTVVLQSNNYFELDEHINCSKNLEEFVKKSNLKVDVAETLSFEKYDRYMIIGKKQNV